MHLPIPYLSGETIPKVPRAPLCQMGHNPHAKVTHSYNIVDDLSKLLVAMPTLEVLHTHPSQKKVMLSTLDVIDPLESHLMTFDLDK